MSGVVVKLAVPPLGTHAGVSKEGIETFYAQY